MSEALLASFDAVVCDLDGVVYRGSEAVPGAVEALRRVRADGRAVAYATNNASRPPRVVADRLRDLGLELDDDAVVTSAQAGARALRERLGARAVVLAVGGPGVTEALADVDLVPVDSAAEAVDGVLQGFGAGVGWTDLAEAAYAVAAGAVWVATNTDQTLPTERGQAPGNGTLVGAVKTATGCDPQVVGKPHAPLYELALSVLHSDPSRTVAVGDRLDTDIVGAHAAGLPSVLVLTGVSGLSDLADAAPDDRPRFLVADLGGLHQGYAEPASDGGGSWSCGHALLTLRPGPEPSLVVRDEGRPGELVRVALAAVWRELDGGGLRREQAHRMLADLDQRARVTPPGGAER